MRSATSRTPTAVLLLPAVVAALIHLLATPIRLVTVTARALVRAVASPTHLLVAVATTAVTSATPDATLETATHPKREILAIRDAREQITQEVMK
jgi:hypothetical protein